MGLFLGFSYAFMVYGPAAAIFFMIINKRPELKLVAISSAFFWLISIMPPSFLQALPGGAVDKFKFIPLILLASVISQEIGRYLFTKTYMFAERNVIFRAQLDKSPYSDFTSAISSGVGFGLFYALVMHGGVISAAFGERQNGDFYDPVVCPEISMYLISAVNALSFQFLHIFLSLIEFDAFRANDPAKKWRKILVVVVLHLLASFASAFNVIEDGCLVGLPVTVAIVILGGAVALKVVRNPSYLGAEV